MLTSVELAHEVVMVSSEKKGFVRKEDSEQVSLPPPKELIIMGLEG